MTTNSPDFESNIKRDRAGRFANKPADEAVGGTDALAAPKRRDIVCVDGDLVPGQRVSGRSAGFSAKGRKLYDATWSGVYVGIQGPTPDDPFVAEDGSTHPGGTIHLFRDGEMNGIPQPHFGFPVDQVEESSEPVAAVTKAGVVGTCQYPDICKQHVAHGESEVEAFFATDSKIAKRNAVTEARRLAASGDACHQAGRPAVKPISREAAGCHGGAKGQGAEYLRPSRSDGCH